MSTARAGLLTETVQLAPSATPTGAEEVEAEIHARLGTTKAICCARTDRRLRQFGTRDM